MHAGDGGYRSRRAKQMDVIAAQPAILGHKTIDQGGNFLDHGRVDFARDPMSTVALRERDDPDRQRRPRFDLRQRRPASGRGRTVEPDELRGAAADVEQDDSVRARIDQRRAAGGRQGRFGFTIDDFELETDLRGDAGAEFSTVGRRTTCLGRNQPRPGNAAISHLVAADGERSDGTVDRRIADAAGGRDAFAQPDDAGERIDDTEAVVGRARDQEPAVVGAEVERGIGRSRATVAALRAVVARMAVGRAPTPPGPLRRHPITDRVEAAGCPALVLHQIPSCSAEASRAQRQRPCSNPDRTKCNTRVARATDARCAHGAARHPCRAPSRPLSQTAPPTGSTPAGL